jgi:hypothetical protein
MSRRDSMITTPMSFLLAGIQFFVIPTCLESFFGVGKIADKPQ